MEAPYHQYEGWTFRASHGTMLPHSLMKPLEDQAEKVSGFDVKFPTVVYPDNRLIMRHEESGFTFAFSPIMAAAGTAFDISGPEYAPFTSEQLRNIPRVRHSDAWRACQKDDLAKVEATTDWTHTTMYWGSAFKSESIEKVGDLLRRVPTAGETDGQWTGLSWNEGQGELPMDLLTRHDPIRWFHELDQLEDDLDDNGVARLCVRVRVMPGCWFVLMRFELRVDGVLFRTVDTRVSHVFGSDEVVREFAVREVSFDTLLKRGIDLAGPKLGSVVNDRQKQSGVHLIDAEKDLIVRTIHTIKLKQ